MDKAKLLNPSGYLSWTQIDMWLRSPKRYVRTYIQGEKDNLWSPSMDFGSRTAQARESREETGDAALDAVVALMPHYEEREYQIRVTLSTPQGDVDLLGRLDNFDPATLSIRDDKTGITRWTQHKADNTNQLKHYAALVYLKFHRLPAEVWLDWAETGYDDKTGALGFTGHLESFRVRMNTRDVLEYLVLASRVAREIDAAYREHLKNLS